MKKMRMLIVLYKTPDRTVVKDRDELSGILSVVEAAMKKFSDRNISQPPANSSGNDVIHDAIDQTLSRQQWADIPSMDATALNTTALQLPDESMFGLNELNEQSESSATCNSNSRGERLDIMAPSHTAAVSMELVNSAASTSIPSNSQDLILPCSESPCDCSPFSPVITTVPAEHGNIWRSANAVLSEPIYLSDVVLHYEETMSEDLAVRVIVEGWDVVERTTQLPPLWKKLRKIDQLQFGGCSETIRLAVLSTMHLLLRFYASSKSDESSKLPPWLHQRYGRYLILI